MGHEPTTPGQFLPRFLAGRRCRNVALTAIVLILLATTASMYSGLLAIDGFGLATSPQDHLAPNPKPVDHTNDQTQAGEGNGAHESVTQHPTPTPEQLTLAPTSSTPTPTPTAAAEVAYRIPPKIWQIMLPRKQKKPEDKKPSADPKILEETPSWLVLNPDYAYTLVSEKGGEEFIQRHFADEPKLLETYNALPNVGMRSDLLRYLLLNIEGGVYTDTDTEALKPIDAWVPAHIDRDKVRAIVGIEFDQRDGPGWGDISHFVQFCQWTIAAAPGHPVFRKMATRVLDSVKLLTEDKGVPLDQLKPTSFEVMNSTGPAAFTDVIFEQLQEYNSSLTDTKDLGYMEKATLFGDILVLPIDGFGMGQKHSNSTHDGTIPEDALVRHLFHGSWRGDQKA
ncbi:glycosyltransferase [Chaetomidium leptoderma]|uniref:Glycosyltransferase n=1 Tax=Chaetomidium leptoderma TaxID=669021 RepID=A0AAN6VID3_9PEZI|nr:glycosyltransferase [Chaetomidium leptoderma]